MSLPSEIGRLFYLEYIVLNGCTRLRSLPGEMTQLTRLVSLSLDGCISLAVLPDLSHLPKLRGNVTVDGASNEARAWAEHLSLR